MIAMATMPPQQTGYAGAFWSAALLRRFLTVRDDRPPSFAPALRKESTHQKTFSLRTHASHAFHARAALGLAHAECFHNCVRHLLDIVRIHQQTHQA